MILDLIAEAKTDGLPVKRACKVLELSPSTVQRWKAPLQPLPTLAATPLTVRRSRPYDFLTASEAATVIALIRSPKHADASAETWLWPCRQAPRLFWDITAPSHRLGGVLGKRTASKVDVPRIGRPRDGD